jgi:sensor histidine kinase YesM
MKSDYSFTQKKNQLFLKTYSIAAILFFIFLLPFLFYYSENSTYVSSFLGFACLNTSIFLFARYFISPLLLKNGLGLYVAILIIYGIASVSLNFALFEFGLIQYPAFMEALVIENRFKVAFYLLTCITLFYVAHSNFLMVNYYQNSIDIQVNMNKARSAEISLLRNQMNPHFLFNAMNNVSALIRIGESQKAIDYNSEISSLLNNHMMHIESNTIRLEEEINWLENYLQIEHKRLPGVFEYNIEVEDEDLYMQNIPPMLLQPLVENSIIHGFSTHKKSNKGLLNIKVKALHHNTISILIKDNGAGVNAAKFEGKMRKSISIYNIEKRIQLINEMGYFTIELHKTLSESGATNELIIKEIRPMI